MQVYNKMHASFQVQVEWGIGGLKRKSKHIMKRFASPKQKYSHMFSVIAFLINFFHKRCINLIYEIISDYNANPTTHSWARNF
jgi:hypothetical protein